MRFLLDENMPRRVADWLRAAGHHADDVRDTAREGGTDAALFAHAQALAAALITTDRDFARAVPHRLPSLNGAIVITLRRLNGAAILARFQAAMPLVVAAPMADRIILVTDNRILTVSRKAPCP
jgi:predicted nuclease of predicted toxin-antitoxin system